MGTETELKIGDAIVKKTNELLNAGKLIVNEHGYVIEVKMLSDFRERVSERLAPYLWRFACRANTAPPGASRSHYRYVKCVADIRLEFDELQNIRVKHVEIVNNTIYVSNDSS